MSKIDFDKLSQMSGKCKIQSVNKAVFAPEMVSSYIMGILGCNMIYLGQNDFVYLLSIELHISSYRFFLKIVNELIGVTP